MELGSSVCLKKFPYKNKNINEKKQGVAYTILLTPKADFSFVHCIKNPTYTYDQLMNAYFQIFIGLYVLNTKYNIHHHDLHYKNVLVKKLKNNVYFKYKIDGTFYTICGSTLFYITDFGTSTHPVVKPRKYKCVHDENLKQPLFDYIKILDMLSPGNSDPRRIVHAKVYEKIIGFFDRNMSLNSLITKFAKAVHVDNVPKNAEINVFNTDRDIIIPNFSIFTPTQCKKIKEYVTIRQSLWYFFREYFKK